MSLFRENITKRFSLKRSSKWWKFRSVNISDTCSNCGKVVKFLRKYRMCLHHIVPFHVRPDLELDPKNVTTLCSNPRCHLDKGHLGNWRSWNVNVVADCKVWKRKYLNKPFKGDK